MALFLGGCSKQETLYSNIDEPQANVMIALLERMGIPCDKTPGSDGNVSILVDSDDFSPAVDVLNLFGYPEERSDAMAMMMENKGLVSTPSAEQRRYILATADQLSKTIKRINGVVSAVVFIVLGEQNPDTGEATPASASVFIKYRSESSIEREIPKIKDLVFNSVLGLKLENISIVSFPTKEWEFLDSSHLVGFRADTDDSAEESARLQQITFVVAGILIAIILGIGGGIIYRQRLNKK